MGDVLHTLPALTDALLALPNLTVDWVVEENFAQIPTWHPAVRNVFPVALRRWRKNWFAKEIKNERQHFMKTIQAEQYDLIIDAQGLIKSAFLVVRHAKGVKHGYNWKSAREGFASLCYDIKHDVIWQQHAVERIRELFAKSLGYTKPTSVGDYAIAKHFLSNASLHDENLCSENLNSENLSGENSEPNAIAGLSNSSPYLIFLHSTTRDEKHWPEKQWIELINLLGNSTNQPVKIKLPWGTELERARAERLANTSDHVEVLPKLTLAEIADQLAHAEAVVSVDTGLSHLAAALSRPNITLFGPTDPKLIGGYGLHQNVLKSPTQDLNDLRASVVFEKLSQLIPEIL